MSEATFESTVAGERISNKALISYMLGGMGENTIFVMIVTFLMIYYTDSVGIPAASVGSIFLLTRIWDTFSDLLWGWLIDNTKTRMGKFRPYILFGGIICSLALIATFSVPKMSDNGMLIYAYITYFILSTSYTSFDIPYWALATAITRDAQERNRIVMFTRTGAMSGQWIASLLTMPLLVMFAHSWQAVAMVYGLFMLFCSIANYLNVRELPVKEKTIAHSFTVYLELLKYNRPLVILMLFWFIFNFTISARVGFGLYYFKYLFHSETAMAIYLGLSTGLSLVGAFITSTLCKRFGKRAVCLSSGLLLGILCVFLFFSQGLSLWTAVVLNSIPNILLGVLGVTLGAMLPDTAAWHEFKNNRRAEGMIFSLNLFQLKLSGAIGGAATGYLLAIFQYTPNIEQSALTLSGINSCFTIIPGMLFLFSPLLLKFYSLSEKVNHEVATQLFQRDMQTSGSTL